MKICICTTPIRPVPTNFPPFGSMAIIQSLRDFGADVSFYNIDYFRHSHEEIEKYFADHKFEVVGISAVVSTAYSFTKYLSSLIRRVSPETKVVVGGNLAASAEILLRKCEVDFCVVGDGELIIRDLVGSLREKRQGHSHLKQIKGICFIDDDNKFSFTGYGEKPSADTISWPDYEILEADGSISYFISDDVDGRMDGSAVVDKPSKKVASVVMTKGCVARCTFCHRWEKGFRARPVNQIIEHVQFLISRYDVGYIDIADENFGADREMAWELALGLGKLGIVWRCAGVRVSTVTLEMLKHWKKNGCVSVIFGIESGSEKMLKIMEKKATVAQNKQALQWVYEADLGTVIQLVIGMPGETDETISETIDFLKSVSDSLKWWQGKAPSDLISINYAQALPGTPLYEWARERGYIGSTIDEEEKYLIKISDTDAYRTDHFINYTGLPLLRVLMWRPWILAELDLHHMPAKETCNASLYQIARYYYKILFGKVVKKLSQNLKTNERDVIKTNSSIAVDSSGDASKHDHMSESGYFNISKGLKFAPLLLNPLTRRYFFPILALFTALRHGGTIAGTFSLIVEYVAWSIKGGKTAEQTPSISLRKIVNIVPSVQSDHLDDMIPLRKGR